MFVKIVGLTPPSILVDLYFIGNNTAPTSLGPAV